MGLPKGALEVDPSDRFVRLFTIEVPIDQMLGRWYYFIKPIHRINNLLTAKWLLHMVSYFIVLVFRSGLCKTAVLKNTVYRSGDRKNFWNHCFNL